MKKIFLLAAGVLVVLLGVGAWHYAARPEPVNVAELQMLATKSCKCERAKGTGAHDQCWQEYDSRIAGLTVNSMATACAPVSSQMDCFETADGEQCVATGFNGAQLCSADEARAAEAAFAAKMDEYPDDLDRGFEEGMRAFGEAVDEIAAGRIPETETDSSGCA